MLKFDFTENDFPNLYDAITMREDIKAKRDVSSYYYPIVKTCLGEIFDQLKAAASLGQKEITYVIPSGHPDIRILSDEIGHQLRKLGYIVSDIVGGIDAVTLRISI